MFRIMFRTNGYVQDERYIAGEHMDVRRDCVSLAQRGIYVRREESPSRTAFMDVRREVCPSRTAFMDVRREESPSRTVFMDVRRDCVSLAQRAKLESKRCVTSYAPYGGGSLCHLSSRHFVRHIIVTSCQLETLRVAHPCALSRSTVHPVHNCVALYTSNCIG